MNKKTMIIAVNAVSGGGKTTVTRELTEKLTNAKAIYFDSYDDIGQNIPDVHDWVEAGADYSLWDLQEIVDDINKLLNDKDDNAKDKKENLDYIVLDYPFGYKQKQIAGFIDLSVYIDTPLDIALARRILRDYSPQGRIDEILSELDSYLHVRSSYHYSQLSNKDADLIVDGSLETSHIVDIIMKKIDDMK
jgi:uridine kinase